MNVRPRASFLGPRGRPSRAFTTLVALTVLVGLVWPGAALASQGRKVKVSPTTLAVTEGLAYASYTVKTNHDPGPAGITLMAAPTGGLEITTDDPANPGAAWSASGIDVTLTSANYHTGVRVCARAIDDSVDQGSPHSATVKHSPVSGWSYAGKSTVTVTVTDNDGAVVDDGQVTTSPTSLSLPEGATGAYSVVLGAAPSADVTINVASIDPTWVSASPSALTFTEADWSTAQSVTVTAGSDDLDRPDYGPFTLEHTVSSSDARYDGLAVASVSVMVEDDDTAGVVVSDVALSVLEGEADDYTIVLTSEPTADVMISVVSADPAWATPSTPSLTFTPGDWSSPQTVTVTGGADDVSDSGPGPVTLAHEAESADPDYGGLEVAPLVFTVMDDDSFGVEVSPSSLLVGEGETGTYEIVLASQPTNPVTIAVASSDPGWASASPASLTFAADDWFRPQTVTVSAADDRRLGGSHAATLVHAASSADVSYNEVAVTPVSVTVLDNDVNRPARGAKAVLLDGDDTAGVHLAWRAPVVRTGQPPPVAYRVYVGTGPKTATRFVKEVAGVAADVTQDDFAPSDRFRLEAGARYYFSLRAVYGTGSGDISFSRPSNIASALAGPMRPRQPRLLKAFLVSRGVRLLWLAPTGRVPDGYLLYDPAALAADPSAEPLASISGWDGNQPNCEITGLAPGQTYVFRVYSFVIHPLTGERVLGARPATVRIVAGPLVSLRPPVGLQGKPGDTGVLLSWRQPNSGGLPDVYRVEVLEPARGTWLPVLDVPWGGSKQSFEVTASELEAAGGFGFYQPGSVEYLFRAFSVGMPGCAPEVVSAPVETKSVAGPVATPPTRLCAKGVTSGASGLLLTWKPPTTGTPAGYWIEASLTSSPDGFWVIKEELTTLSYLVTAADFGSSPPAAGSTVHFRVGAYWYDPLQTSVRIPAAGHAATTARWPVT